MIAEILGYIVKNGIIASNHNYIREVSTQEEIESIRSELSNKYNTDKTEHKKEIMFILRQRPGTNLKY